MKIACFFATSGHSGVDRLVGHLISGFADANYPVDLLQIHGHGPFLDRLPRGVNRIDLKTNHVVTAFVPLIRYLRRERPTVLLCDKYRVNRTALIARICAGVETRVVVRVGTTVSVDLASRTAHQRWMESWWMRLLYPYADAVVTPSCGAALDLAQVAHLPVARVLAVPSPVIISDLAARAAEVVDHPWLQSKSRPVILSAGELCSRKDFETLIRAFAIVRSKVPVRLIILGEGRQRGSLTALAQELGVSEDLSLPGFVPNPYAFMARADVFAFTSRWEGAPLVLIEALAVGVPVVSTDCPSGPREILQNGRYGPLVPVGDPERVAEAVYAVLHNPLPKDKLREASRPYTIAAATAAYLRAMGLPPRMDEL